MGAPKQKWTPEEEEALRAGVDKHGAGKWRTIQKDPEFSHCLATRSNIDLKDKWRNMSIGACGHGSREQIRAPKVKGLPAIPSTNSRKLIVSAPQKDAGVRAMVNPTKNSHDGKNPPRYTAMISEALVAMQKQNGSEIGAICSFIEVQKGYRLKDSSFATKTLTLKQKDPANRSKLPQNFGSCISLNSIKDAAITAAYKIADAEAKSFLASEAVKEAEKISKMVEETDSLLLLAKEIFERCAGGEIMTMA
ncbi:single myb histone 4-like isoform X2 [Phoenix dactylifera]|uniref:Single myb histone 4-like isoform X2 n=1 Tax=Phoenix dactylifera TaxID=42345 RepID=A0A8B7CUM2_PHODC|nr:single myb histone 4-like isoform X2 [Phoenix dactylifera]